ncbi:calpain-A-like isoform X1 [Topomyia yanbarensis]|uniref:calpain-A-like isoform X1 n=1 Tax=Topomyia yanbarensis TaxID=2498891 RepID=UPI00273C6BD4|nr:calpain-A-like isoform X1 [Topomyia yanbarensis]
MSFHNENYNYPRNWNANGFGWVNPAAFNQSPYPQQMPTPASSGYSSLNPSLSGSALSYGFAPGVVNPSPAGYPPAPAANLPYPSMGFGGYGGMPMPNANHAAPQTPMMPMPGGSFGSTGSAEEDVAQSQEIPFQAVAIPVVEGMFSSLGEKGSGFRTNTDVQDYYVLRSQCRENGSLFEDPEFPATSSSLMYSRRPDRHYEWLRPHEIADSPEFFVEGFSRFDVQQGELGDCWLLAACANLTRDQTLFLRVVPEDNSFEDEYAGIFHFRFWQYGRWVDVVIDDRLPTYRGELIYMRSSEKNEFWSALLEKAYAKLHGSYEALKGGTTCEAMEDFTGGVTEMYDLKDQTPPNLFQIMEKGYFRNSMFACSIEPDPNVTEAEMPEGLIRGHAYSITKIQMADIVTPSTSGKIPLIRLRNPWGNEAEWNGAWSDQSPEWRFIPDEQKEELGLSFDVDGEFWMSYRDFIRYFDRIEICNLSPDSLSEEQESRGKLRWEMSTFEGEWAMGSTAGGCRNYLQTFWHNPQYVVHLEDPDEDDDEGKCTIIIALMQKNRRSRRNMGVDCLTIGFAVYRLTERDLAQKPQKLNFFKYNASVARSPSFINLREVSCRFKLPPGNYLIVPSTFEPNEEGEFLIRVFSENKNTMEENDEEVGVGDMDDRIAPDVPIPSQPSPQRQAMERLFLDVADADGEVDWVELKRILDHSFRDDLPKSSSVNGLNKTRANQQNAANYDGGGGDDAGGGLLAQLCGLFCKDTPLAEAFGGTNGPRMADANGNLQNDIIPIQHVDQVGAGFSKDVCRSMVAMLDVDQSGKLGFEEFQCLLTDIANWKAVFKLYDQDRTGRLSSFELRQALNSAGYHLNNRILNGLVHRYGSRDGSIAFDDFIMCAVKIKTMIDIFRERDTEGTNMATFSMDEWVEKTLYS